MNVSHRRGDARRQVFSARLYCTAYPSSCRRLLYNLTYVTNQPREAALFPSPAMATTFRIFDLLEPCRPYPTPPSCGGAPRLIGGNLLASTAASHSRRGHCAGSQGACGSSTRCWRLRTSLGTSAMGENVPGVTRYIWMLGPHQKLWRRQNGQAALLSRALGRLRTPKHMPRPALVFLTRTTRPRHARRSVPSHTRHKKSD